MIWDDTNLLDCILLMRAGTTREQHSQGSNGLLVFCRAETGGQKGSRAGFPPGLLRALTLLNTDAVSSGMRPLLSNQPLPTQTNMSLKDALRHAPNTPASMTSDMITPAAQTAGCLRQGVRQAAALRKAMSPGLGRAAIAFESADGTSA